MCPMLPVTEISRVGDLNVVWLKAKEEAWRQITEEFNAANPTVSRVPEQLKNCWKTIKQGAKKKLANEKVLGLNHVCTVHFLLLYPEIQNRHFTVA